MLDIIIKNTTCDVKYLKSAENKTIIHVLFYHDIKTNFW